MSIFLTIVFITVPEFDFAMNRAKYTPLATGFPLSFFPDQIVEYNPISLFCSGTSVQTLRPNISNTSIFALPSDGRAYKRVVEGLNGFG